MYAEERARRTGGSVRTGMHSKTNVLLLRFIRDYVEWFRGYKNMSVLRTRKLLNRVLSSILKQPKHGIRFLFAVFSIGIHSPTV